MARIGRFPCPGPPDKGGCVTKEFVIEAILCNGDREAAISSAVPGGGPADGNKVEPGLFPENHFYGFEACIQAYKHKIIISDKRCVKI